MKAQTPCSYQAQPRTADHMQSAAEAKAIAPIKPVPANTARDGPTSPNVPIRKGLRTSAFIARPATIPKAVRSPRSVLVARRRAGAALLPIVANLRTVLACDSALEPDHNQREGLRDRSEIPPRPLS